MACAYVPVHEFMTHDLRRYLESKGFALEMDDEVLRVLLLSVADFLDERFAAPGIGERLRETVQV